MINKVLLSPEILLGPVLLHEQVDPSIAATIEKAFLDLHIEDPAALESAKACWSEASKPSPIYK